MQHCMCRLPVSAAAESRTDAAAAAAAGSSGSRTYKAEAAALTETLQRLRPFAFLADFPQASDLREAETSCFQQVGFEGGPDAFKFEKKKSP